MFAMRVSYEQLVTKSVCVNDLKRILSNKSLVKKWIWDMGSRSELLIKIYGPKSSELSK